MQTPSRKIVRSSLIGPTIAEDIQRSAYMSVIFGILGIALYILLRFRSIAYSIGSALSLIATVVVGLGVYALPGYLDTPTLLPRSQSGYHRCPSDDRGVSH